MEKEIVKIGNIKTGDIVDVVTRLVKECAKFPNNKEPDNKSGYLTIRSRKDGRLLIKVQIGECPIDKCGKYAFFSWEKSERLLANIKINDHLSSWQSRAVDEEMYAGAIATNDFVLSFSGLPELADEAVVLVAALTFNWANWNEVVTIVEISKNPFFDKFSLTG